MVHALLHDRLEGLSEAAAQPRVICVDLDGTLIAGDLLWEAFFELVKRRPVRALAALVGLLHGKAHFKRCVAREVRLDAASLPYRVDLVNHLRDYHARGAHLVLATASDEIYAVAVADHLHLFHDVIASDGRTNMSGRRKAEALVRRYGEASFAYAGNDFVDMPVWNVAARTIAVAVPPRLARALGARGNAVLFGSRRDRLSATWKALRPYQWVKNLLVFVPAVAAHQFTSLAPWLRAGLSFAAFSLCASAIYIVNDIVDIKADRKHPRKQRRPFAAGELSIPYGLLVAAGLLATGLAIATLAISIQLTLILCLYLATTTAYSFVLKRRPVADVFTLAGLYVLRIFAGGVAVGVEPSSWLLAFALFLFLSLAFVKRYAEVATATGWLVGRGYRSEDATWLHAAGMSLGYMAVLVLALYVTAPETTALYLRPKVLWMLCPLILYWQTRLWLRAARGLVNDDPVLDALKDVSSFVIAGAAALILLAAMR